MTDSTPATSAIEIPATRLIGGAPRDRTPGVPERNGDASAVLPEHGGGDGGDEGPPDDPEDGDGEGRPKKRAGYVRTRGEDYAGLRRLHLARLIRNATEQNLQLLRRVLAEPAWFDSDDHEDPLKSPLNNHLAMLEEALEEACRNANMVILRTGGLPADPVDPEVTP